MADAVALPRGRHGLSREEVAATQRARVMLALADAVGERGYGATSVADVLRGAGVSRQTFYEQFSSKLDCFLATFDAAGDLLLADLAAVAVPSEVPALERFDRLFTRYLDVLAGSSGHARVLLVECHAAGPEAIRRRGALQERIVDALVEVLGGDGPVDRFACTVLVAAIGSLVTEPLIDGDVAALHALRAPVVALVGAALATRA